MPWDTIKLWKLIKSEGKHSFLEINLPSYALAQKSTKAEQSPSVLRWTRVEESQIPWWNESAQSRRQRAFLSLAPSLMGPEASFPYGMEAGSLFCLRRGCYWCSDGSILFLKCVLVEIRSSLTRMLMTLQQALYAPKFFHRFRTRRRWSLCRSQGCLTRFCS